MNVQTSMQETTDENTEDVNINDIVSLKGTITEISKKVD
jgi:hypothetical protein